MLVGYSHFVLGRSCRPEAYEVWNLSGFIVSNRVRLLSKSLDLSDAALVVFIEADDLSNFQFRKLHHVVKSDCAA